MKTQGTQGPETYDERVNAILRQNWDVVPRQKPPFNLPPTDFERGLPPPYGHGRTIHGTGLDGLFGVPPQHLQHMAGDVINPGVHYFSPGDTLADSTRRMDLIQNPPPAGYANPGLANSVAQGVLSGKVKILSPSGQ